MGAPFHALYSFYHTEVGIYMLVDCPTAKMVLIHRVDTESDYNFTSKDLRKVISLVWATGSKWDLNNKFILLAMWINAFHFVYIYF